MANTTQTTPAAQADNTKAQAAAAAAVALPQAGAKFRISAARTEQQAKAVTEADNGLLILTSDTQQVYLAGKKFGGLTQDDSDALQAASDGTIKTIDNESGRVPQTGKYYARLKFNKNDDTSIYGMLPIIGDEGVVAGCITKPVLDAKAAKADLDDLKSTVAALSRQLNPLKLTVSGGGTFEKGSTQAPTFTWAIQNGGNSPTVTVKVNGTVKADAASPLKLTGIKADTTVAVTVAAKDGQTASGQASATFIDPVYVGKVAAATAGPDAAAIKAGDKKIVGNVKAFSMNVAVALANEKLWYAYPATRGELTGAKDLGVNMDGLSGFQKTVVKLTTLAGEEVNYNVYTMKDAVTASARYAFS